MPKRSICAAENDQIRYRERGCDSRNCIPVLAGRTSGEKAPSNGAAHTRCIGSLPWTPIGCARGEGVDGIACQVFLGSAYNHHFKTQSVPVPRQGAINLAATSQGDSPSELNIYRHTRSNNQRPRVSAGRGVGPSPIRILQCIRQTCFGLEWCGPRTVIEE